MFYCLILMFKISMVFCCFILFFVIFLVLKLMLKEKFGFVMVKIVFEGNWKWFLEFWWEFEVVVDDWKVGCNIFEYIIVV